MIQGTSPLIAWSEFLDEFYLTTGRRQSMIDEEPGLTGVAWQDAYVGAMAEHLARRWGLAVTGWVEDPRRFLSRPYFVENLQLMKPVLLRDSPIAFRRLIFTEAEPLRRARFPRAEVGPEPRSG
jgi:hypothetical protein